MMPPNMPSTEDNPDAARAAALAAWLREQPLPRRARAALLRDLQLITGGRAAAGELPRLRGLDREAFVRELHAPGGGAVGRVAGIGEKALAALRAAIPAPDRAPTAAPAPGGALAAIAAAAQGLLVPSESDYPLVPFRWEGQAPLTPAALLAHLGLPPDTPVETRTLEAFFDPLARTADWMDEGQRAQAARFAALRDLIAARLRDVVVYRVGRVRITVLIAGQDAAGATVGLRTTLIET